jgi:hypothetical protein
MGKSELKVPPGGVKWLKAIHIYLGSVWGGGAASLFALHCLYFPDSGPELYARNMALIYIDSYIIIPSALGVLLTGLVYAQFTRWGYVKYYWVIAKWLSTLVFVLAGFLWIVPWLDRLKESSTILRDQVTIDPSFSAPMFLHVAMAGVQALLVLFIVIISVLKPWGRTGYRQ